MSDSPEQRPLLRIVKGDATPEEVAALVAVVAALANGGEPPRASYAGMVGAPPQDPGQPPARPGRLALQCTAALTAV